MHAVGVYSFKGTLETPNNMRPNPVADATYFAQLPLFLSKIIYCAIDCIKDYLYFFRFVANIEVVIPPVSVQLSHKKKQFQKSHFMVIFTIYISLFE